MDVKGNGIEVQIDAARQTDEWLVRAAEEINQAAAERGLVLPAAAGAVAITGAQQHDTEPSDKDRPSDTKESLATQLRSARNGYTTVIGALAFNPDLLGDAMIPIATEETFAREFEAWLTEDKLTYLTDAQEADPDLGFTLVAIPNVKVTAKEVRQAAVFFGLGHPTANYILQRLYDKYSDDELSGTDPDNGNAVTFSLIPTKLNEEMYGTVAQQRAKLVKLQKVCPGLKVPSVLEAITLWNIVRAQNSDEPLLLADDTHDNPFFVRHFNLPAQSIDGFSSVPISFVAGNGELIIDGSSHEADAVVSIG